MTRRQAQALFVGNDALLYDRRVELAAAALRYKLPTIVAAKTMLEDGGLVDYGSSDAEQYQRVAAFVAESFAAQNLPIFRSNSPPSSSLGST